MSTSTPNNSNRKSWLRRWAIPYVILILIVIEVGASRQDWLWSIEPRSNTGIVYALEDRVIRVAEDPAIVFMGSSRVRDAVAPRVLEEQLELPVGSVLNLGLTEGSVFDSLTLYERNREKLADAEVLVVGVEIDDFVLAPRDNNRLRRFAPLSMRFQWQGPEKLSLVLGWFYRTYDARPNLRALVSSIWRRNEPEIPIAEDGRVVWREPVEDGPSRIEGALAAETLYAGEEPGVGFEKQLQELVDAASADGVKVAIIHVPVRDSVADALDANFSDLVEEMQVSVAAISGASLVDLTMRRSSVSGLEPTHYVDYGHVTADGGLVLTAYYGQLLSETFSTELEASRARPG